MEENIKKHHCFLCNKYYKSRFSLSNHKRIYHIKKLCKPKCKHCKPKM